MQKNLALLIIQALVGLSLAMNQEKKNHLSGSDLSQLTKQDVKDRDHPHP